MERRKDGDGEVTVGRRREREAIVRRRIYGDGEVTVGRRTDREVTVGRRREGRESWKKDR